MWPEATAERVMMKKNWIIGVGLVIAVAVLVWAFIPKATEVEVGRITVGRFERSVQDKGKLRVRARYVVSAPVTGTLQRISLKEGDVVTRGQVLAVLTPITPALLDERARQAQSEHLGALQANVSRTEANIARAQAALAQAQSELQRSERLAQQGFVSPNQADTLRMHVQLRRQELESARQEDHAARHALQEQRIALQPVTTQLPTASSRVWRVLAPVDGRVLKIHLDSEATVQAGSPLIDVGDPKQLEVRTEILTEDATQVQPGAMAELSHWGGAQSLPARVRLVEPAAFTKVSALGVEEQRVNVVLDLLSPAPELPAVGDGFKVDVRIVVQVQTQALMVPVSAIFPLGAEWALLVVDQGRARQQRVKVLARNGRDAWLDTALKPGTEVVVYPPSRLKDGDRLTFVSPGC